MKFTRKVYVLINKNRQLVTAMGALPSAKTVYTNKKEAEWDALNFDESLGIKVVKASLVFSDN